MNIKNIGSGFIRPPGTRDAESVDRDGKGEEGESTGRADRSDRVGLSAAGVALAAKASEIEARIEGGVYDDPAMAEEVARRILSSGDLDLDA